MSAKRNVVENLGPVIKRLDAMISLLFELIEKEGGKLSVRDKILILHSVGLQSSEIARIIRRSVLHVSKELSISKEAKSILKERRESK